MERSIFGFFTAFLCVICLICAVQTFRKKRFGLAALFLLNAFYKLGKFHSCFLYDTFLTCTKENK